LLREEGYDIELAGDGEEGLLKISKGGYDLVLLDIMLPKIDGLEIMRRLKKQKPEKPNGSIVLLTNLGQDSIIKEGFSLGASGYLIKSAMNPDQVLSEVKVFLTKGGAAK
jgi:DNA-binding response OmpR family regulator